MNKIIFAIALTTLSAGVMADELVKGYTKKDGTYVAPHYRTTPNKTVQDNYGTKGNTNPYTGQKGTESDDPYAYKPYQPYKPQKY